MPPELAGFLLACTVVALLQQTMAHRYLLVFLLVSCFQEIDLSFKINVIR
jgi:hypothetical protein